MDFFAGSKALNVCQSCGEVGVLGSPEPSRCLATGKGLKVATVGERASVIFQAFNFIGQPYKERVESLECELLSEVTGTRARGSIGSQNEISYQPTIKGRHQLHIKVEDQHIRGSPFGIAVKSPVEKLGTPILTINVPLNTSADVAVNQRGEIVVTKRNDHCISVFSSCGKDLYTLFWHRHFWSVKI